MTLLEAIQARHSVRSYADKSLPQEILSLLQEEIDACNRESGLHIQAVTNEPKAFDHFMAHYGKFSGVQHYIALIGRKSAGLDEQAGYYGERIALRAQMLGLNTCWAAMTFGRSAVKRHCRMEADEKLVCVLALGYGNTQGVPHRSKAMEEVCKTDGPMPEWFQNGMAAALLAPTASNQQKFLFTLAGNRVSAKATGGFYAKVDLGIVKYHFEAGAGLENFRWN